METVERINITPDKSIYSKLGQAGYTVAEALAELIDNAIDARVQGVDIEIDLGKEKITVQDNGRGMDKKTAAESIVLGKSNKKAGELGQFGLGLKTACMSLGKRFVIETTTKNSDELYILTFDEDEFLSQKTSDWSNFEIKVKKGVEKGKSGTKITIEKLKVKTYPNLLDVVRKHLGQRFAPFIKNKEVSIRVNTHPLRAEMLKVVPNSKEDFVIELSNKGRVTGWLGILERGSLERSGFNLYKFRRLIRAHEKLGYAYHPSKMWLTGEIHLDPIPVTHNKREFVTEHPLYIEFFEKFLEVLKPILAKAQKRHREDQVKDLPPELRETLMDNLLRAVEKVDDFRELAFPEFEKPRRRSQDDGGLLSDKERRGSSAQPITDTQTTGQLSTTRNRTPRKTSPQKVRFITVAGQKYKFDYRWDTLDDNIAKTAYLDKERKMIMVILNANYRLLHIVKPDLLYYLVYLTEGITEVFLKENRQPLDRITLLRDKLVQQLADVISEDVEERRGAKERQLLGAQLYLLEEKPQSPSTKRLSENEKIILKLRLENGYAYQEIAKTLGLTRQRVHRLFGVGLKKINAIDIEPTRSRDAVTTKTRVVTLDYDDAHSVIARVSETYGVPVSELLGRERQAELILPRHLAIYILREKLHLSFPQIARITKRNDHTTVMHAYNKIKKLIAEDRLQDPTV